MPTLTKDNAKDHCRTCLSKLKSIDSCETTTFIQNADVNTGDAELKDICINITRNDDLQQLLIKYIGINAFDCSNEYPKNLCFCCYNKLHTFDKFTKRAQESDTKLQAILSENGINKVEIDYDDLHDESTHQNEDIYKLLIKGSLMETESVILDSTSVTALTSVDLEDPDPFDATPALPNEENINIKETIDTSLKKTIFSSSCRTSSYGSSSDCDTFTDKKSTIKLLSDKNITKECIKKTSTRFKLKKKLERGKMPAKKRRRTKKEMEELRVSQNEKLDCNIQRRNRGTKNNFKCNQCNHCFAHKITLDAHIRKIHEGSKRPFQCDRCEKSYTFIGGLYTHIKEIHEAEVRSYNCDYVGCDRIYTSFIAMQKHKRLKHSKTDQQKKYVCEQCGATFNQSGNLKYHRRTKHPTEAEQAEKEKTKEHFICEICEKQFHSRYTLKYHTLQQHTNDMRYECNVCGRRMAKKFMLVQHMLVHSTDKMPCEHCGKQFIRKFELEAHIRVVHMKLKPYECQYCSECFGSRKTLRHHEYIHTGEKPYVCDICGQAYRQQTCLKNHRKSHEKLSNESETVVTANLNRTLLNTFLAPQSNAAIDSNNTLH